MMCADVNGRKMYHVLGKGVSEWERWRGGGGDRENTQKRERKQERDNTRLREYYIDTSTTHSNFHISNDGEAAEMIREAHQSVRLELSVLNHHL